MSEEKKSYKYLVSACLAGEHCRYDCRAKPNREIIKLIENDEALAVCPEEMGGLSTPRSPAEWQSDGRIRTNQGEDVTESYQNGASRAIELAKKHGIREALLKGKSPMCGVGQIYDGSFRGVLTGGDGELAKRLKNLGITVKKTEPS